MSTSKPCASKSCPNPVFTKAATCNPCKSKSAKKTRLNRRKAARLARLTLAEYKLHVGLVSADKVIQRKKYRKKHNNSILDFHEKYGGECGSKNCNNQMAPGRSLKCRSCHQRYKRCQSESDCLVLNSRTWPFPNCEEHVDDPVSSVKKHIDFENGECYEKRKYTYGMPGYTKRYWDSKSGISRLIPFEEKSRVEDIKQELKAEKIDGDKKQRNEIPDPFDIFKSNPVD
jgi:hypothetical protein